MKNLRLFLLAVAIVFFTGCQTDQQRNAVMASWMGHNVNDLIASWGAPDNVMADGKGGQILIYDKSGQLVLPGETTTTINAYGSTAVANSYTTPGTVIKLRRQRMFWVDSNGTIYRWAWRGR